GIPAFAQAFEGVTFPPALWSINNPDSWTTWVRSTAPAGNGSSTASAFMNFYDYSSYGAIDDLVSPSVDLTGLTSAELSFKVSYAEYSSSYHDSLLVLVSNDCGFTYSQTPLYAKTGAALATSGIHTGYYTPAVAADWRTEIVDLSSFIGSIINVKFVTINGYGNNLYLDDININGGGVSVSEITGNDYGFIIYPNPATDDFLITFSVPGKDDASLIISDMNGRIIFRSNIRGKNKLMIHSADFAAGVYNIAVSGERIYQHKKLVIVK
ncbi:MAG: hypothetical protein C0408_10775, partial [Odoribacter sp.]|nr:hypothetical protein [Odoribacter sp.]